MPSVLYLSVVTYNTNSVVLWDMTPCSLVDGYEYFGGIYCLYFEGTVSILKLEEECLYLISVSMYQSSWCHITGENLCSQT
jgi:hypothetical protein